MKKFLGIEDGGFTLVELLIVIALIAILSVAVLATINPIEQANKAKDSTIQNDAAEVMNAYERYYANAQAYPWMTFTEVVGSEITVDDAVAYQSDYAGFGICYADAAANPSATIGECNTSGTDLGVLIQADELKPAFVGKGEFQDLGDNNENALWMVKQSGSGGSIYVCYIPKAKSNRQLGEKLYCIEGGTGWGAGGPEIVKVGDDNSSGNPCVALSVTAATWSTPTFDGETGMFRCVPE